MHPWLYAKQAFLELAQLSNYLEVAVCTSIVQGNELIITTYGPSHNNYLLPVSSLPSRS